MKLKLPDQPYRFITEDTNEVDAETAFLLTPQNQKYFNESVKNRAHSVISPADIGSLFGLNRIAIVGITGTNGKTTTASAIHSILLDLGYKSALQGTRGFFINETLVEGKTLTTPSLLNTYRHIYQAVREGCRYFIMEVSSHAIVQKRVEGLSFALRILTNITQDHLDYHQTFENYVAVKNSFFQSDGPKLINKDEKLADFNITGAYTYGVENPATYKVQAFSMNDGLMAMVSKFDKSYSLHAGLYGYFNLYNIMAAVAAVDCLCDDGMEAICNAVEHFGGVSGRMQCVSESPLIIVDFAHTPDGMFQVFNALKEKNIIALFGAGGDRDKEKRQQMGRIASGFAKTIIITSDNPRTEDPEKIVSDILSGIEKPEGVHVELDRKKAIKLAMELQQCDDVLLILGKGDEEYQIIYDKKIPFDDREIVKSILNEKTTHVVH